MVFAATSTDLSAISVDIATLAAGSTSSSALSNVCNSGQFVPVMASLDDTNLVSHVRLVGVGASPQLAVSPRQLDFAQVRFGPAAASAPTGMVHTFQIDGLSGTYSIEVHNDAGDPTSTTLMTNPGTGIASASVSLPPDFNFTVSSPTGLDQTLVNFTIGNEQHHFPPGPACGHGLQDGLGGIFPGDLTGFFFGLLGGNCR
jgi:hypothetical protein